MIDARCQVDPWFAGAQPFPYLGDWQADAALFAQQSLQMLAERGQFDPAILADLVALESDEWQRTLLHPATFAFVATEGRGMAWGDGFDAITVPLSGRRSPAMLATAPAEHFAALLQQLGPGSRRDSCAGARYLTDSADAFHNHHENIDRALSFLDAACPGFGAELEALVEWIGLVDSGASFRGASGVVQRGLILLSPDPTWTWTTFAEELVHETTHTVLDVISLRQPLLTGDGALRAEHAAPFRPDLRPLYGNFHAVVVVARLVCLFEVLERTLSDPDRDWAAVAFDYVRSAEHPLQAVRAYDGLNAIARTLLEESVVPVFTSVLGRPPAASKRLGGGSGE